MFRRALIDERIGGLLPLAWSAADDVIDLAIHHQVGEVQGVALDAVPGEHIAKGRPSQVVAIPKRALDNPSTFRQSPGIES